MEQLHINSFVFHPEAEIELTEAVNYYNNCEENLGYDFSLEVFTAIQGTMSYPYSWQELKKDLRRVLINRFPYGVIYSINNQNIVILAIMHLHRKPNYWNKRRKV